MIPRVFSLWTFQKGKTLHFQYPLRFIIKYISLIMPVCMVRDAEGPTGAIGTRQQSLMAMMIELYSMVLNGVKWVT